MFLSDIALLVAESNSRCGMLGEDEKRGVSVSRMQPRIVILKRLSVFYLFILVSKRLYIPQFKLNEGQNRYLPMVYKVWVTFGRSNPRPKRRNEI